MFHGVIKNKSWVAFLKHSVLSSIPATSLFAYKTSFFEESRVFVNSSCLRYLDGP